MAEDLRIDPNLPQGKVTAKIRIEQPTQISSPAQQTQVASQLRQVRMQSLNEFREEQEEDEMLEREGAEQSLMPSDQLRETSQASLNRLRERRDEELKQAQKKFKQFDYQKKKQEIVAKYRQKAKKEAEKCAKVAAQKLEQAGADGTVTLLQEIGPLIMETITYVCLLAAGLCGLVDWIGDWVVAILNMVMRALAQYNRVKQLVGFGESETASQLLKDMAVKFLSTTVLPVAGGAILESVPYLDYLPWAEVGAAISGLIIVADLLKSYVAAKAAEAEANKMANQQ